MIDLLEMILEWVMCFAAPMFLVTLDRQVALIFVLGVIAITLYRIGNLIRDKRYENEI